MFNVLVVDDEALVRIGLKSLVDWESYNISLGGEAENGKGALAQLEKQNFDLLLTDLNMPVMDGLNLIQQVVERYPNLPVVVLSAYDDYNLVRQAFKLGAVDYILKNEMQPADVLELVRKLIPGEKGLEEEEISENESIIRPPGFSERFASYLNEEIDSGEWEILKEAKRVFRVDGKNMIAVTGLVDGFSRVLDKYKDESLKPFQAGILNSIVQVVNRLPSGGAVISSPSEYLILFSFPELSSSGALIAAEKRLGDIRHLVRTYVNTGMTFGLSSAFDDIRELRERFRISRNAANLRFFQGTGKTYREKYVLKVEEKKDYVRFNLREQFQKILVKLEKGNYNDIKSDMDSVLSAGKGIEYNGSEHVRRVYLEFIYLLQNYLGEKGMDSEIATGKENKEEYLNTLDTWEEVHSWTSDLLDHALEELIRSHYSGNSRSILKARRIIAERFEDADFCRKDVADTLELSQSYFSHLFMIEVGKTFSEYLNSHRIEEAKKLLKQSNMKLYEVARAVGYTSLEHFSRTFKKQTGISPGKYR